MDRASKLDKLTKDEREELVKRLHNAQNSLCYVCGQVVNLLVHEVDIDHIIALARNGADDESNWGLTHSTCNRSKGTRDLRLQRLLHQFKAHVDKYTSAKVTGSGGDFTLYEAMKEFLPAQQDVGCEIKSEAVSLSWTTNGKPVTETYHLLEEKSSPPARSFVAMLPFECLHHDRDINPRSIVDLEPMIEEFYGGYPQLQPSLATLNFPGTSGKTKILLFDGQHKAAAQLYAGKQRLLVRVFLNDDKSRLKETNYRAHTKLAQVHFPQLINDRVGADLFHEQFDRFTREADPTKASERSFFQVQKSKAQRSDLRQYFQNYLRYEVLTGKASTEDNHVLDFTETVTARSKRYPLSYDTLQHTFLQHFLFLKPARESLNESERYRRYERENLVRLMNVFVEEVLAAGRFDLTLGIYRLEERLSSVPDTIPDSHLRAYRMCRKPAMVIWSLELVRAVSLFLNANRRYASGGWPTERPLWVEICQDDWKQIRQMVRAVRDHKLWGERSSPDLMQAVASTKQKNWAEILLKGTLPGRQGAILPALDHNFIFKGGL